MDDVNFPSAHKTEMFRTYSRSLHNYKNANDGHIKLCACIRFINGYEDKRI